MKLNILYLIDLETVFSVILGWMFTGTTAGFWLFGLILVKLVP
jgi:hypothetical protein